MIAICYTKFCGIMKFGYVVSAEKRLKDFERTCHGVQYLHMQSSPGNGTIFQTLITDLLDSDKDIFAKISKNCKYKIKRAEKEGVEVEFYNSSQLTKDAMLLKEYKEVFYAFTKSKGLNFKFPEKNLMRKLLENNALIMAVAKKGEEVFVYHMYLVDGTRMTLFHSISLFRNEDDTKVKNQIGMANRLLHWKSILYAKEKDYQLYDWGGYSKRDEEHRKIAEFKEKFGGKLVKYYNYNIETSTFILLKPLFERYEKMFQKVVQFCKILYR